MLWQSIEDGQNINFAIPIKHVIDLYNQWDKSSYEPLGTVRSWNMTSITPSPTPRPTPTPTPAPTPEPETAAKLPQNVFLNKYGISAQRLSLRQNPLNGSPVIGDIIEKGTYVYIIINQTNKQNEVWSKVLVNGKEGYIRSKYIYQINENDSTAYDAAQSTPAPVFTATPEPTAEPKQADTLPVDTFLNQYGILKKDDTLRIIPTIGSPVLGDSIKSGEYIYLVINKRTRENGACWTLVNYKGQEGYIRSENIYILSEESSREYDSLQDSPAPIYTATPTPSPTPTPTPTPSPTPSPTPTPQLVNYGNTSLYKIVFDQVDYVLYSGTNVTIKPVLSSVNEGDTVPKNVKYVWSSDNIEIAEVTNGKIVAHRKGTTKINCALEEDPSTYSCVFVKVLDPVTEVALAEDSIVLLLNVSGKTEFQLEPHFLPEGSSFDEVIFQSNNNQVASVDGNGLVTAGKIGSATISVTAVMNGINKRPVAKVRIDVKNIVTSIEDAEKNHTISIGKTVRLTPAIQPKDASNKKLEWISSNDKVATVDKNGNVKGISAGSCTITCKATDEGTAALNYDIKIVKPVSSIKNKHQGDTYPPRFLINDSISLGSLFTVEPYDATMKELSIEVYKGKDKVSVLSYAVDGSGSNQSIKIRREGLYTIIATTKDGTKKTAKATLRIQPADQMMLELYYAKWNYYNNDNLGIQFEIINKDYGTAVAAVELYVYAVDSWGNKIYGENVYYGTTEKHIAPGKKIYSDRIVIPNRSRISQVYCGIHKIKFNDNANTIKTYTVDYYCWDIN